MRQLLVVLLVCACVAVAGCVREGQQKAKPKGKPVSSKADFTHVITSDTVYYMSGPQQARPPEGKFKAGTKVTLVRKAGSYSVVRSETGIQAYVSTGSLRAVKAP